MASLAQLTAQIDILTQNVSDLNDTVAAILSNTIIVPNYVINASDPNVKVGDKVIGYGFPNINGGGNFMADVVSLPISTYANISNPIEW
ncbi:hypothetical protein Phi19:1_gp99 [Cellulophaga phage phi19:1]|uniref:Uncharacterized protein n=1 Tax=Cellulophaga phage phi19:1 TaxID=1327970 RepID=R9ZW17_9CAUD|nr:hypothetical protein Phi19:1_gp99 [Cellulophaga phage phi19:1]AGO47389.1 hypothetical protein Phi19:1_gp99 [Cellulophaga phage phi19:1]